MFNRPMKKFYMILRSKKNSKLIQIDRIIPKNNQERLLQPYNHLHTSFKLMNARILLKVWQLVNPLKV